MTGLITSKTSQQNVEQSTGFSMSAPVLGLNLVDPIDQMEAGYALSLENVVPNGLNCSLRKGHTFLNGLNSSAQSIDTLQGIANIDGTNQVIAASSGTKKLYRVTSGSFTDIGGAYTSTAFNSTTFAQQAYFCNGIDDVQVVGTGLAAASTFSGVALTDLINVSSYKERVYFIKKNSMEVWFGNTRATGASALTSYDFQFIMRQGGFLVSCGSFSNNYADSTQDLFYALSSEGELVFYNGSSPADVTTPWGIVKRADIGRPLGYKAFISVENDIWLLTDQGIVPITALFSQTPSTALETVGQKINPLIAQTAISYPFSSLWSGSFSSKERKVYLALPLTASTTLLLVYSLIGQAWTTYTFYQNAIALKVMSVGGTVYYAGYNGNVYTGEINYTDFIGVTDTVSTSFFGRGAFSFYGNRGLWKAFRDIRPLIKSTRSFDLSIGLDTDFRLTDDITPVSSGVSVYTPWGSPWGSPWSSGLEYIYDRHAIKGQGYSAAIKFGGTLDNYSLELNGFDVRYTQGTW